MQNSLPRLNLSTTHKQMGKKVAQQIAKLVTDKPDAVIGLATGSTPDPMYKELIRMHKENGLDFSRVRFFNLDEYVGLPYDRPQSYHYEMREKFFKHINAKPENIHIPDGMAEDLQAACADYEKAIRDAGGIDLQILGIGETGHIGFNEPGTPFDAITHISRLSEKTRADNARFFGGDKNKVPTQAITMGLKTITAAKQIILMANGEHKGNIVREAMTTTPNQEVPASILQQVADKVTFFLDRAAAKHFKPYQQLFSVR